MQLSFRRLCESAVSFTVEREPVAHHMTRRRPARDLRLAIDCLPIATRRAMLEGIEANRIIVGAYTDRQGGICPMLAAHRNGGRTSLASFARAWDHYTGARGRARPARPRELNTLRAMLEASVALEEVPSLADVPRPRAAPRPTGERHRAPELRDVPGWRWLRPFRRLDEYERALAEASLASDLTVARAQELDLRNDAVARRS
jgi:hypothetical protein